MDYYTAMPSSSMMSSSHDEATRGTKRLCTKRTPVAAIGIAVILCLSCVFSRASEECIVVQEDCTVCDVLIVGGGSSGISAAIQAGRAGAKTVLIDSNFQLGGTTTSGGVSYPALFYAWGRQVIAGTGWELVHDTVILDHNVFPDFSKPFGKKHWEHQVNVNPALYSMLAEEKCLNAGVEIRYFESPVRITRQGPDSRDAAAPEANWKVLTSSQGQPRLLFCKVIVDCTGNAAVADMVGAQRVRSDVRQPGTFAAHVSGFDKTKITDEEMQVLFAQALEKKQVVASDIQGVRQLMNGQYSMYVPDADNSTGQLRGATNQQGRQALLRAFRFALTLPGGDSLRMHRINPEVGVRETWRVVGEYVITKDDYVSGKVWPDSICYAYFPIDIHDFQAGGASPQHLEEGIVATVPLRALCPKGIDDFLVAGRCISSDREANSALRVQATCMGTGQAAGAAAALAAKENVTPLKLDLTALKVLLKEHGAILPEENRP
ncbi:MAG: FAD-dependent oxidoreductase [Planctomycetia bacterium]|nr:FAD-dependent oxidoreductase [Planctomycetia bacterium]